MLSLMPRYHSLHTRRAHFTMPPSAVSESNVAIAEAHKERDDAGKERDEALTALQQAKDAHLVEKGELERKITSLEVEVGKRDAGIAVLMKGLEELIEKTEEFSEFIRSGKP